MIYFLILLIVILCFLVVREFAYYGIGFATGSRLAFQQKNLPAISILKKMLNCNSPVGKLLRNDIRHRLSSRQLKERQYDDCIEQCRLLISEVKNPLLQSVIRHRMADAMEMAGNVEEANQERSAIEEGTHSKIESCPSLLLQGSKLMRQQKFEDAITCFEKALAMSPPSDEKVRPTILAGLSNAAFQAGRMKDAAEWGDQAVLAGGKPALRVQALKGAGLAYGSLGEIEKSENYLKQAVEFQLKLGNTEGAGETKAILAGITRKRGHLVQAIRLCEEAIAESTASRRNARVQQYECLMGLGRWSEAREMLESAYRTNASIIPEIERRAKGLMGFGFAIIHMAKEEANEAIPYLDQASETYAADGKVFLMISSYRVWAEGQLGVREKVESLTAELEELALRFPDDRNGAQTMTHCLSRAWLAINEPGRALEYIVRYGDLQPDPVDMPKYHYVKGECLRMLNRNDEAMQEYQASIDLEIECYYAELAKVQLVGLVLYPHYS